jgi:RNA polymerase primary sigma factor
MENQTNTHDDFRRSLRRKARPDRRPAAAPAPTERALDADSLRIFFQQAAQYPLLTAAEEIELAKRIERGDVDAKDRMTTSNLRLVIAVARGYRGQGLPFGDLIQEGMLGLIRAVEKFDWRKGFKFSTYATLWIRQAIQRGLANSGRAIRLPAHIGQRERKVARAERELTAQLGREPTLEELAVAVELEVEQVADMRSLATVVTSIDTPVSEDGETTMGDLIPSKESPSPEDEAIEDALSGEVERALQALDERERNVVELRFGLRGGQPLSLRDAGKELGLSTEGTRRIEERALNRLLHTGGLESLRDAA